MNVVGSNNALYDGTPGAECQASLNAIDPGCRAATAEHIARNAFDIQSLQYTFQQAKAQNLKAVLIDIQANIFEADQANCNNIRLNLTNIPSKVPTGFQSFMAAFLIEAAAFNGQVLLVHGDSHFFRECNPTTLDNVTFLMVPGSGDIGWIRATINADAAKIFSFQLITICTVQYRIFNGATDAFVANIVNGTTITNPPCGINIQAATTCAEPLTGVVTTQLRSGTRVVSARGERDAPYFLFGDSNGDVFSGTIPNGSYNLRSTASNGFVFVPGAVSFSLAGTCVP